MQMPHLVRRWQVLLLGLGLFALAFAVFASALGNGFVGYDDPDYVTGNWHVQNGLSWGGVKWAFTSFEAANWHPLTWLSHQLDAELFGLWAWGHHLTSLFLHALNGALLFVVLRKLTACTWRSLVIAALFAVHPLRVESVAWISERKDVLSATFFFLTLLVYGEYVRARGELHECGGPRPHSGAGRLCYMSCLVLFGLGLMAKPMLVTLPFVLLLLDYWPLRRFRPGGERYAWRRALLEKVPFLMMAFIVAAVTIVAQGRGGAIIENAPLASRMANAVFSYVRYIGKLLWPVDLSPFYPPPPSWPTALVLASALFCIGLVVVGGLTRRRFPWLLVGWLWFVGMLVPVVGLVQAGEQAMADRYSYLPSIGLLIMVVWWLELLVAQADSRGYGKQLATCAAALTVCGTLAGLAVLTRAQIRCWQDTRTLFAHALRLDPGITLP